MSNYDCCQACPEGFDNLHWNGFALGVVLVEVESSEDAHQELTQELLIERKFFKHG
jgi:hypothetical protein